MTINPRVVRALRNAREKLRDAAAAEHNSAATDRDEAARRLAGERDHLSAFLADAHGALAAARNVHDLAQVAAVVDSHHTKIADASRGHAEAAAIAEVTAGRLRDRARQLRTAERLVDMSDRFRAEREARVEQRGADDLNGRRR
jgi:hypothetical protein